MSSCRELAKRRTGLEESALARLIDSIDKGLPRIVPQHGRYEQFNQTLLFVLMDTWGKRGSGTVSDGYWNRSRT